MKFGHRFFRASCFGIALLVTSGSAFAEYRTESWYYSRSSRFSYLVSLGRSDNAIYVYQYGPTGRISGYGTGRLIASSNTQSQGNRPTGIAILNNTSKDYSLSWTNCRGGLGGRFKARITNASGSLGPTRYLVNLPGDSGDIVGLPAVSVPANTDLPPRRRYGLMPPPRVCSQTQQSSSANQQVIYQSLSLKMEITLTDKDSNVTKRRTFNRILSVKRPTGASPNRGHFFRPE